MASTRVTINKDKAIAKLEEVRDTFTAQLAEAQERQAEWEKNKPKLQEAYTKAENVWIGEVLKAADAASIRCNFSRSAYYASHLIVEIPPALAKTRPTPVEEGDLSNHIAALEHRINKINRMLSMLELVEGSSVTQTFLGDVFYEYLV